MKDKGAFRFKSGQTVSLSALQHELEASVEEVLDGAIEGAGRAMEAAIRQARELAPVDTGRLRGSIGPMSAGTEPGQISMEWGSNVEYAPYVELGTGEAGEDTPVAGKYPGEVAYSREWTHGMPARPFLYPSVLLAQKVLPDLVRECIAKKAKGGDG